MDNFDHIKAQKSELDWQTKYIKEVLPQKYEDYVNGNDIPSLQTWLPKKHREAFLSHLKGKTGLDIGCGSIPALRHSHGLKKVYAIDPLATEYERIQESELGGSFFKWLKAVNSKAEVLQKIFVGSIDGVIICRNAIDHAEDPLMILANISEYAVKGCYFLFWTDIWHLLPTDDGHRNITRSTIAMDALLEGLGFKKLHDVDPQHDTDDFIEYGGVFIKE